MAFPLFRGHKYRCAANGVAGAGCCTGKFCDAEIGQQQVGQFGMLSSDAHEKIGGFNILMHYLVVMCILQCIGGLMNQGCHGVVR